MLTLVSQFAWTFNNLAIFIRVSVGQPLNCLLRELEHLALRPAPQNGWVFFILHCRTNDMAASHPTGSMSCLSSLILDDADTETRSYRPGKLSALCGQTDSCGHMWQLSRLMDCCWAQQPVVRLLVMTVIGWKSRLENSISLLQMSRWFGSANQLHTSLWFV